MSAAELKEDNSVSKALGELLADLELPEGPMRARFYALFADVIMIEGELYHCKHMYALGVQHRRKLLGL